MVDKKRIETLKQAIASSEEIEKLNMQQIFLTKKVLLFLEQRNQKMVHHRLELKEILRQDLQKYRATLEEVE